MDATLRDLALRVIPVLDGTAGSKELFLFTSKYFANQLVGASNAAQEELGLIMASRLRGTYAVQAAQKKCKTHDELVSKVKSVHFPIPKMLVVMDPSLRLFALQTIPILDDSNDTVELFRYVCQYFNQRLRLSSPECREELAIIVMSKLRGNRARKAVLMQCKTYEEIEQSLSASVMDAYIFKNKQ